MGEYVKYKNESVKIGTCESMYYVTYQQFIKALRDGFLKHCPGNSQPADYLKTDQVTRFRFPFPDEDGTDIGYYENYNRGLLMYFPKDQVQVEIGHNTMVFRTDGNGNVSKDLPVFGVKLTCPVGPDWPADSKPLLYDYDNAARKIYFEVVQQRLIVTDAGKHELQTVVRCPYCDEMVRLNFDEVKSIVSALQRHRKDNDRDKALRQVVARMLRGYIHPDVFTGSNPADEFPENDPVLVPDPATEPSMSEVTERSRNALDHLAKIETGKTLIPSVPSWAKAVIIAEHMVNDSDPYTDYFASHDDKTVYLAWSSHTRDLFPEMRKAADLLPETAHLGIGKGIFQPIVVHASSGSDGNGSYFHEGSRSPWHTDMYKDEHYQLCEFSTRAEAEAFIASKGDPHTVSVDKVVHTFRWEILEEEIEHREKWSMGHGYYLGRSKYSGWTVRKTTYNFDTILRSIQLAAAEGRCVIPPTNQSSETKTPSQCHNVQTTHALSLSSDSTHTITWNI